MARCLVKMPQDETQSAPGVERFARAPKNVLSNQFFIYRERCKTQRKGLKLSCKRRTWSTIVFVHSILPQKTLQLPGADCYRHISSLN